MDLAKFIKEELQPYIRSHYRTTEHSLGIGHSLGASFMAYALINNDPFDDYFLLSPNFAYGKDHMLLAQQFVNYQFGMDKNRFLYFSDAGEENEPYEWTAWKPARELVYAYLTSGKIPNNVVYEQKSYTDYDHYSSFPIALLDAYKDYFLYRDSMFNVANAQDNSTLSNETYKKHIEIIVTDPKQEVFITGNQESLGNWEPSKIKLKHINDSVRAIDVELRLPAQFKFTLGDWSKEASFKNSYYGANLVVNCKSRLSYIYKLKEWLDN